MKTSSFFRSIAAFAGATFASLAITHNAAFAQEETPTAPVQKQTSTSVHASPSALGKITTLETEQHPDTKTLLFTMSADKLHKVAPEFVKTQTETIPSPHARMSHMVQYKTVYTVDYVAMMPLFLKALQEQQAEIERLRNEVALLQARAQK